MFLFLFPPSDWKQYLHGNNDSSHTSCEARCIRPRRAADWCFTQFTSGICCGCRRNCAVAYYLSVDNHHYHSCINDPNTGPNCVFTEWDWKDLPNGQQQNSHLGRQYCCEQSWGGNLVFCFCYWCIRTWYDAIFMCMQWSITNWYH